MGKIRSVLLQRLKGILELLELNDGEWEFRQIGSGRE
jgi:hypothetical protein